MRRSQCHDRIEVMDYAVIDPLQVASDVQALVMDHDAMEQLLRLLLMVVERDQQVVGRQANEVVVRALVQKRLVVQRPMTKMLMLMDTVRGENVRQWNEIDRSTPMVLDQM